MAISQNNKILFTDIGGSPSPRVYCAMSGINSISGSHNSTQCGQFVILSFSGGQINPARNNGETIFQLSINGTAVNAREFACGTFHTNDGVARHLYINAADSYVRAGNTGIPAKPLYGQIIIPVAYSASA